jgi:hypothetical protein
VVTGPRRAGKTTLLRKLFPNAHYVLLEDPNIRSRIRTDPRGFLHNVPPDVLGRINARADLIGHDREHWIIELLDKTTEKLKAIQEELRQGDKAK